MEGVVQKLSLICDNLDLLSAGANPPNAKVNCSMKDLMIKWLR